MAQTPEGAIKIAAHKIGVTVEEYRQRVAAGQKHCGKCRQWVALDGFHVDRSRGDGRASVCKSCRAADDPYSALRGRVSTFKGRKHSDEAKRRMSEARRGNSNRAGKPHTAESRRRISVVTRQRTARGRSHYAFSHGRAQRNLDARRSADYTQWRMAVFQRDGFACQRCGDNRGGNLNAHHIAPFAAHPGRRFDVSNGQTLCETCHRREHHGK